MASSPAVRTWGSYSPEEKEKSIHRSAMNLHLREYWSQTNFPHLEERGIFFVKTILPEPITEEELGEMLAPIHPREEFHFCDYITNMDARLAQDDTSFRPLRQRLEQRIDLLAKELDDYDLTLVNFHTLLGIYLINLAVERGLVTPSEKPDYFRRKSSSL